MRQKIMISLTKRHIEAIDWYANYKNITRSEAIRELIERRAFDLNITGKPEMRLILWQKLD